MPELPEVQGLVDFLRGRLVDDAVAAVELASFTVLKTFDPPPQELHGAIVTDVARHGKWIDVDADGRLVISVDGRFDTVAAGDVQHIRPAGTPPRP